MVSQFDDVKRVLETLQGIIMNNYYLSILWN